MITLTFSDLTPDQAAVMLDTYRDAIGGGKEKMASPKEVVAFANALAGRRPTPNTIITSDHPPVAAEASETPVAPAPVMITPEAFEAHQAEIAARHAVARETAMSHDDRMAAHDVDNEGTPYNPELHATNRTIKDDGTWRMRRHVEKKAYEAWRKQHAGGASAAVGQSFGGASSTVTTAAPAAPMVPTAPAAPAVPTAPAAPAAPAVDYETEFMPLWNKLYQAKKLPMNGINAVLAEAGRPNDYTSIPTDPAIRSAVYALLQSVTL